MGFVNSEYFCEAANHFKKYGRYSDGDYGTYEWDAYWERENDRVLNGYTVGGAKITGKHYLYLNYLPIQRIVSVNDFSTHKTKGKNQRRVGKRDLAFPDFWDEDFILFHTWDIAKYGITEKELKSIEKYVGVDRIPIVRTEENLSGGRNHLWLKPRGVGAPQPISEIVITPTGEKTIGDLKIGDYVFNRQGEAVQVSEIHPQGELEVWEIELLDGRKVKCGKYHTWTVETRKRKGIPEYKDIQTWMMAGRGLTTPHKNGQKTYNYKIPELYPVQFEEKELPIPPYVLGALLGNGSISGKNIKIATDDVEVVDKIINDLNKAWNRKFEAVLDSTTNNYYLSQRDYNNKEDKLKFNTNEIQNKGHINRLKREIELLELNVKGDGKFIPEIYKYSSIEQRMELVRGLMDTDGYISEEGNIEFTQKYEKLIDDLAWVLRSLGICCSKGYDDRIDEKEITDRTGRTSIIVSSGYHRLYIISDKPIFYVKRKADRVNTTKRTRKSTPIVAIRNLGYKEKQICIGVDTPEHLYLTRDFIVTHNSWKGAVLPVWNQFFFKNTRTYLVADREKFLKGDGLFTKYLQHVNSLNKYGDGNNDELVSGFSRLMLTEGKREMEYKTGYISFDAQRRKVEKGKRSLVKGIIVDGDPNNIRGIRGDFVYEEFGSFRLVDEAWQVARSSTEEDGIIYGTQYGFGTGGDEDSNIEPLTKMFNDPRTYNILEFENIWDKDFMGLKNAYFTPAYISIAYKDDNGNSIKEEAKEYFDNIRTELKDAQDPTVLPKHKAEKPFNPAEALSQAGGNIFPTDLLQKHKIYLLNTNLHKKIITTGNLERSENGVTFKPNPDLIPYIEYPVTAKSDKNSAVCIIHTPYKKKDGRVPENMYRITVDPYRHDSTTSESIGSIYVIENINRLTPHKGDKIVAWYNGRPPRQEDFNKILFDLAIYYNCKIAPENDEPGGIVDYAKVNKLRYLLEAEFELAYDVSIQTKKASGKVGMHIASGKNNLRKDQGDIYISEWLQRGRGIDSEGNQIMNLHTIYDIGLLTELIEYNSKKNADRVSALRINMFYEREFIYKQREIKTEIESRDLFFETKLFG